MQGTFTNLTNPLAFWRVGLTQSHSRRNRKKAHYSLDAEDGIKYSACFSNPSPTEQAITVAIRRGLENMKKYLKNIL